MSFPLRSFGLVIFVLLSLSGAAGGGVERRLAKAKVAHAAARREAGDPSAVTNSYDDLALIRLALGDRVGAQQRLRELAYGDCVKGIHNPRLGLIID